MRKKNKFTYERNQTSMTHEKPEKRLSGRVQDRGRGGGTRGVCASDWTDGVHKALDEQNSIGSRRSTRRANARGWTKARTSVQQ